MVVVLTWDVNGNLGAPPFSNVLSESPENGRKDKGRTRGARGRGEGGQGEQREEEERTRGGQGERGEEKRSNKVKHVVRISYFLVTSLQIHNSTASIQNDVGEHKVKMRHFSHTPLLCVIRGPHV